VRTAVDARTAWTEPAAEAIGATWLLAAIAPGGALGRAASERGTRRFLRGDEAEAQAAIERVDALAHEIDAARLAAMRATLAAAPDITAVLARASVGAVLGDVDFFEIGRFIAALAEIAEPLSGWFAGVHDSVYGALQMALGPGRSAGGGFYLADAFDPELANARAEANASQTAYDVARSGLLERIARYVGAESVRDGEFVLMRDHAFGPLPREIHVVRESPAYLLCDVSLDAAALDALAARDTAIARVAEREESVRARLSQAVAAAGSSLAFACEALGDFDLLAARAQFAQRHRCIVPEIADAAPVAFVDARFLPLEEALERHGRRYAPISLELEGVGVVTGPNMGGKTAALRTLGFLAACASLGVPVPAASARLPLFDEIAWLGIAARAVDDDGLLSSFGSEVVALRDFLSRELERPLVLIDEFARTTSPREGRALLVAVLETLYERGALALAATHLANVAPAGAAHFAIGGLHALPPRAGAPLELEAALRRIARAMDYSVQRVASDTAPPADAIALADALGLDPNLIARALGEIHRSSTAEET
jgi:DNA mismatch repair protein MutS2